MDLSQIDGGTIWLWEAFIRELAVRGIALLVVDFTTGFATTVCHEARGNKKLSIAQFWLDYVTSSFQMIYDGGDIPSIRSALFIPNLRVFFLQFSSADDIFVLTGLCQYRAGHW